MCSRSELTTETSYNTQQVNISIRKYSYFDETCLSPGPLVCEARVAGHVPRDGSVAHTREAQLLPRTQGYARGPGPGAGGGRLQDHWGPVLHVADISKRGKT